jgi:hypothetical protein
VVFDGSDVTDTSPAAWGTASNLYLTVRYVAIGGSFPH